MACTRANALLFMAMEFITPGQGGWGEWHMGPMMFPWMGWMGIVMMVVFLIFLVLLIVAFVYGIKWLARAARGEGADRSRTESRAMEILKERYAKGEITKEDFERMKSDLKS